MRKNVISLSSAEFAQRVVKVNRNITKKVIIFKVLNCRNCGLKYSFRGINTLSWATTLSKLFLSPFKKRSTFKGDKLLQRGANSFLLR